MMGEQTVTSRTVEVAHIDHREWLVNGARGHEDGMGRTPLPGTAGWDLIAGRQLSEFLDDIFDFYVAPQPSGRGFPEGLFGFLANHEDDPAEACPASVVKGVFHDQFAIGSDRFEHRPAAITASGAACKD